MDTTELEFIGEHIEGKANEDVQRVYFHKCELLNVPRELSKRFPNMRSLSLQLSKICRLTRDDLKEYCNLEDFALFFSSVPFMPGDLFADFKSLQYIWFARNVNLIEPQILDNLTHLKYVDLSSCSIVNDDKMIFSTTPYLQGYVTLDEIKKRLKEVYEQSPWKGIYEMKNLEEKLLNDLKKGLQDDTFKDLTIKIGDEEFKAHKMILASRSSAFARVMENHSDVESLHLFDITPSIFREMLNFIYTNELPQSDDIDFMQLLTASEKMEIKELANFAAEKLVYTVNEENALEMIGLANNYGHMKLRDAAFDEIKKMLQIEEVTDDLATETEKLKELIEIEREKKCYLDEIERQKARRFNELKKKIKAIIEDE
jgi:hypothetical protein